MRKNCVYENGGKLSITVLTLFIWHDNSKHVAIMTLHLDPFYVLEQSYFIKMSFISCKKHFQLTEKEIVILNILVYM